MKTSEAPDEGLLRRWRGSFHSRTRTGVSAWQHCETKRLAAGYRPAASIAGAGDEEQLGVPTRLLQEGRNDASGAIVAEHLPGITEVARPEAGVEGTRAAQDPRLQRG